MTGKIRFKKDTPSSGQLKVLILDDEKPFTEELNEFFRHSGYKSFEANTWDEAQKILETEKIDLLILDVRLPQINGLDVLKKVKNDYPTIEVIIVSAHGDMDTVIAALRLGAIDYLRKPFRHIDIQIAIERTHKFLQLHREIEMNDLVRVTYEEFMFMIKNAVLKFTFGSDTRDEKTGRLDYCKYIASK